MSKETKKESKSKLLSIDRIAPKINIKKVEKIRKKRYSLSVVLIKIFIITILILGLYFFNMPFSNTVTLLAVSETNIPDNRVGSLVDLKLTTKPGSGEVFVKLNTIGETDTQISIINSQKIACDLFQ